MGDLVIRRMAPADHEAVRDLIRQLSSGTIVLDASEVRTYLAIPTYHPLVAVLGDQVVGFAELHLLPNLAWRWSGRIENVVVDLKRRGSGIGLALCTQLIALGDQLGCTRFELRTENDSARRLYERLGFRVVADSLVMVRK